MEQVAEALKQLQVNGEWNFDLSDFLDKIRTNVYDQNGLYFSETDVMATLDAIVEIYGKKTPVIEWHDRSGVGIFEPGEQYEWEHDVTGDIFIESSVLTETYPQFANKWTDGIFGGNIFESCGMEFRTTGTIRGIGYKAVIAFDENGNGIVFF